MALFSNRRSFPSWKTLFSVGALVAILLTAAYWYRTFQEVTRGKIVAEVSKQTTVGNITMAEYALKLTCGQVCDYNIQKREGDAFLKKEFNCHSLLVRMKVPPGKVYDPPLRTPPPGLMSAFTQNGALQLKHFYFKYAKKAFQTSFSSKLMANMIDMDKRNVMLGSYEYMSAGFKHVLKAFENELKGKRVTVIGTQVPWVEVMLLNTGVTNVTAVDYNEINIEHPSISFKLVTQLAEEHIKKENKQLDVVVSFSSIEHAGLGRYGDPLNPYGDLEAAAQVWCMLIPGGLFFLGVPAECGKEKGTLVFNGHRIYGEARLQHLTANFIQLQRIIVGDHAIMVLRKPLAN
ncbi:uncharacterized protein LOC106159650 [Lingula anatina]|uniref:Uncharacterized protein LOC106159650 n=1 Tax=Lingula anatina TaxID=7574 RepID=A0A1S3HZI9_LINAN|nr:uncharacterized protein LOC106159650 [Lingula anatina]|eukprot:XP_013391430.1 uncharacterized protein LOC106159650 [Lingula anatina]